MPVGGSQVTKEAHTTRSLALSAGIPAAVMLAAWMLWTVVRPTPDGFGKSIEATAQPGKDGVYEIAVVAESGTYRPNVIYTEVGQPLRLMVTRKDPSPCFDAFRVETLSPPVPLPLGQETVVTLPPTPRGEFSITCAPANTAQVRGTLRIH
jgi:plastocyanin domain-containing protein